MYFNYIILLMLSIIIISCGNKELDKQNATYDEIPITRQTTAVKPPPGANFEIIERINHDVAAYTQGLIYYNGYLYESTGHYGKSTIRKIDPKTGNILMKVAIPDAYFGEGITIYDDKIYVLTWESRLCLIVNIETFKIENTFSYVGEGWGLTHNENFLIMSDGTNLLRFIDPASKSVVKTLPVSYNSRAVKGLNELEYINGKIWANLYGEDRIAVIDPTTGGIDMVIDFGELRNYESKNPYAEVFNGIAYNKSDSSIYLTGKNWSGIARIKIN